MKRLIGRATRSEQEAHPSRIFTRQAAFEVSFGTQQ